MRKEIEENQKVRYHKQYSHMDVWEVVFDNVYGCFTIFVLDNGFPDTFYYYVRCRILLYVSVSMHVSYFQPTDVMPHFLFVKGQALKVDSQIKGFWHLKTLWACPFSIWVRRLAFTQGTGSFSSMACTLIWTFTTLSGKGTAGHVRSLLCSFHKSLELYLNLRNPAAERSEVAAFKATDTQGPSVLKITCEFLFFDSILDILRKEARVLEGLHNLGIKEEHQGKLLRLPVNIVDDNYALDIRHPSIMVSPVQSL